MNQNGLLCFLTEIFLFSPLPPRLGLAGSKMQRRLWFSSCL